MDHRDKQGLFKTRSPFHPMISYVYVINDDWYLLIHTWQSVSEQTLPTADNSVPLLHPQNRHASELLVVGLPMATRENKTINFLMKRKGLILYQASKQQPQKTTRNPTILMQLNYSTFINKTFKTHCLKVGENPNNQDKEHVVTVVFYLSVLWTPP